MSSTNIKKVCVIGAGVMGQGIAAQFANARIPVLLLDIVPPKHNPEKDAAVESAAFRNKFAAGGLQKALKAKPALFYSKKDAALVETGNLDDDLDRLAECDWVIEVIVENLKIKQNLFAKIDAVMKETCIVSSNTSGLSIADMLEGRSDNFKGQFLVTHFFNPVRYLHLLELVAGEATRPAVMTKVSFIGENVLGKGIVHGKDTPNFVANRIGVYGIMETMRVMMADGYSIEEVDATLGPALGRPKSAVFRTADVVGLDVLSHVAANSYENIPDDECRDVFLAPSWLKTMVSEGHLGQKVKKGFYQKIKKDITVLDTNKLKEGILEYRAKEKVRTESLGAVRKMESLSEKIAHLTAATDRTGVLAWKILMATNIYSANRFGEISDSLLDIDNALKWGFNYEMGPFETWDAMGVQLSVTRWEKEGNSTPSWVKDMLATGRETFYATVQGIETVWCPKTKAAVAMPTKAKELTFAQIKTEKNNVVKNGFSAMLIDLGDGVLACEFTSKMNALDAEIMEYINHGLDLCEDGKFNSLVLANDGQNFSVGANILMIFMAAQAKEWDQLNAAVLSFQTTMQRLKYSSVPTIAAPFQMALGGGCEISMWCNKIRAHAETYMGLVEVGVGLLPGAGGNIELLDRALKGAVDSPTFAVETMLQRAFENIAMAKVATSAEEARDMLFLNAHDSVTLNRSQLLNAAKQDALGMANAGFRAPRKRTFRLPGKSGLATFQMAVQPMFEGGFISEHDMKIAMKIAGVLTGGDTSSYTRVREDTLLELEREAFVSLCGEEKTLARIGHMLQTNKPLRN